MLAKDIIIEGGGPFEFGSHEFTEAELSALPKRARKRAADGLSRLRDELNRSVPSRRYESNLLVATWSQRRLCSQYVKQAPAETLFYMAQVISTFNCAGTVARQRTVCHSLLRASRRVSEFQRARYSAARPGAGRQGTAPQAVRWSASVGCVPIRRLGE